MNCPKCGAKTYRSMGGKDICPSCGYGSTPKPKAVEPLHEPRPNLAQISDADREELMRPGRLSKMGFLGPSESLETVLTRDTQTLQRLGLTHEDVASAIERVILSVLEQRRELTTDEHRKTMTDLPNLYRPETIPRFTLDSMPRTDQGWLVGRFHLFTRSYRGLQECPWACEMEPDWSSFDFLILNRRTGEFFTGPGMAVHLIRAHHFFEGLGTPFRVDPARAVRVLELAPHVDPDRGPPRAQRHQRPLRR